MKILAFDTATRATTVALCEGQHVVELRDDPPPGNRPGHATRLLPLVSQLLQEARTGWESIDRIAVGVGPGTFTGLRIGIATAKALARAAELPLVGVSTLRSLALNAASAWDGPVAGVLDARRGEVYAGVWEGGGLDGGQEPLLAPRALAPEALGQALQALASPALAIGDGAVAFRERLERTGVYVPQDASELHRVTATGHCRLAPRLPVVQPDQLHPDYQRRPDAQPRLASPTAARPDDG